MKIEIEVYKGQTIFYDDDADKFLCDISIEDRHKQTKRASLNDIRKEIDTFIKINLEFKPFKCFESRWGSDYEVIEITGIRTDGKLLKKGRHTNEHLHGEDLKKLFAYDIDVDAELTKIHNEKEEYFKGVEKRRKELLAKLNPLDLSRYDSIINQSQVK